MVMLQGASNEAKRRMYYKTLRQLVWWCVLMAIICSAFLLLLMSTPRWIDPTFSLNKVCFSYRGTSCQYLSIRSAFRKVAAAILVLAHVWQPCLSMAGSKIHLDSLLHAC